MQYRVTITVKVIITLLITVIIITMIIILLFFVALLHCYLYAVQGPQATMIPLFLAHFTNYKEVTDDDDDDYDNDYDDKDKLQFQCISI